MAGEGGAGTLQLRPEDKKTGKSPSARYRLTKAGVMHEIYS
ncbi:hypothetical protein KNP414_05424 [Paenibacillus mucilaginosus KNP414]|uniref:Uncharacterized protein n=1 Tax=Paenibacillus mucilaginosus (strain KNP414) TaxID=1036673 RepID=F8FI45_PAEMK|nr:hypothetical protein KNP414_05424 [Paenibacillus mucilaginosus KNP414]